ncbi:MAG: hypothetical protein Tsb005_15330 [Gammaproteobacteria bacterium]
MILEPIKKITLIFAICFTASLCWAEQAIPTTNQLQQARELQQAATTQEQPASATNNNSTRSVNVAQLPTTGQANINNLPTNNAPTNNTQANNQTNTDNSGVTDKEIAREQAFQGVVENLLPMSPEQIVRLRRSYDQTQYAATVTPRLPPKPVALSKLVNLAPGSTPPVIRLAQGFITSLVFVDSTGAPWPIQAYDLGNPSAFNIQWDRESNTMMIQASQPYTYGNLAVQLSKLSTPVMITLIPGQRVVDYRVDMRIQGIGPQATALPIGDGLPTATDPLLLGILDGVAPSGSTVLEVTGGNAQAWLSNGKIYLRSRLAVVSPGWISTVSSLDGMHVYELPQTSNVLVSDNGKLAQLRIKGL